MKIISLVAENVKKLVAVEIRPNGNLVAITGRNGQGKSSVLDSIWWALAGATHIQAAPIRNGANKARIRLDLGELIVTRTFSRKEDGGTTTAITVENAEGARFPSPQSVLDKLLGELSFDPLAFARMKPEEQFEKLKQFVPGVDFAAIEAQNKRDYDARTTINREAKLEKSAADIITLPADTPAEPVDEAALVSELETAGKTNADIETKKGNRQRLDSQANQLISDATTTTQQADALEQQVKELRTRAQVKVMEAQAIRDRLAAAPPLPEPVDTTEIRAKIDSARFTNANVRKAQEKRQHEERAAALEAKSAEITARMDARDADKMAKIAAAAMPVEGLGFGAGHVTFNGVPFKQASDAEQLRVSVAMAMALNPKLRVIRIRDGSLLDEEGLRLIAAMADEKDMQVWIERVDSSGKIGFVLEDGHARRAEVQS